jgi:N utilization substance protein B
MSRKEKRLSRIVALQAVYADEVSQSKLDLSLDMILEELDEDASSGVRLYAEKLTKITIDHKESSDILIVERLKNWEMKRLSLMDKLILRLGISEMLHEESVPPKVSIVEGVEIAKLFSTPDSGRFVNGILDSIYNDSLKGLINLEK